MRTRWAAARNPQWEKTVMWWGYTTCAWPFWYCRWAIAKDRVGRFLRTPGARAGSR